MNEETKSITGTAFTAGMVLCILRDIVRRWLLILMAVLIACLGTCIYQDTAYTPQYSTTTTFVATAAGTSSTTYQNLSAATTLANVFTEVLNSSLLRTEVIRQEGITGFDGTITAAAIPDTNLLTMTVTGSDPRTVFLMSRAIIKHHGIVSHQILGNTVLEVLQDPAVPTYPNNPQNTRSSILRAVVLSGGAMVALLGFLSYRSSRIRSKEEADKLLTCHVLGQLRHEKKKRTIRNFYRRSKAGILITNPAVSFLYTESVNKLCSRVEKRLHPGENVLMVTSLLENEGKSTVAANLALAMARKGKRVLLLDCDLRKPACNLLLGLPQNSMGVLSVLQGKATLQEAVQKVKNSSLHAVSGSRSLSTATDVSTSKVMTALLRQASTQYDLVVVDTPPMSLAPDAEGIAGFAHAALLVVRQNEASAEALNKAAAVLDKSQTHLLGCVLNNVLGSGGFAPAYTGSYGRYGKYGRYGYGYGYGYGYSGSKQRSSHRKEGQK